MGGKMKKTILLIVLLFIPLAYADNVPSGGGGIAIPLTFSFAECNEFWQNQLVEYEEATERLNRNAGRFAFLAVVIFLSSVIYLLICLGMTIQKIKDKGFKKWFKESWRGK